MLYYFWREPCLKYKKAQKASKATAGIIYLRSVYSGGGGVLFVSLVVGGSRE